MHRSAFYLRSTRPFSPELEAAPPRTLAKRAPVLTSSAQSNASRLTSIAPSQFGTDYPLTLRSMAAKRRSDTVPAAMTYPRVKGLHFVIEHGSSVDELWSKVVYG